MKLLLDTHAIIWWVRDDRILIARARGEGGTIVTHDRAFEAYGVPVIWT